MDDSKGPCDDVKDAPSSSRDLKPVPEAAVGNFIAGKRHMLVHDYKFAVQNLATACEMYAEHYGEMALECGEVYFLYGKALFRLSQQQAGVLGDALNEGSNEEESENTSGEESKENESEKNSDEGEGNEENDADKVLEKEPSESTDSPLQIFDENSVETKEISDTAKEETVEKTAESTPDAKEPDEENEEDSNPDENDAKEGDEDHVSEEDDLELAWNTLETAKQIFKRQNDVSCQLKVAEILQLLAEISMESDNNQAAITDLKECLAIQEKHLKPDDRILAETYYQMGLAQMLDKLYHDAQENFKKTMQILELRIQNLKNSKSPNEKDSFKNADTDNEIQDLESILGDIKEKVEDTEELIRNTKKELEEAFAKGMQDIKAVSGSGEGSSKPVSNITHLLKRKKPEDGQSEGDAKRIKSNPCVPNGESKVTDQIS